jgi:predicted lipoprotein with Yx(FWY)xxD motif
MHGKRVHIGILAAVGLGILLTVAACGTSTPSTQATTSAATVSAHEVNGQQVLVDQTGAALYVNDQDGAQPRCVSSDCNAIWTPLTVPGGTRPTAGSGVTGTIATVQRPDGSRQVTLSGKPLYTFSFDHGAGHVTGNGQQDSFAGTNFTWHSALASGQTQAPADSNGGGNGYPGGY